MKYFYDNLIYPISDAALSRIENAADELKGTLCSLNLSELPVSGYCSESFSEYVRNYDERVMRFTYEIALASAGVEDQIERMSFVDHGGGTGITSLLAKSIGFGNVIYNDICDESCRDAQTIADAVGLRADQYVCGDIDQLAGVLRNIRPEYCVLISNEVIEHIYDIESFLCECCHLTDGFIRFVMATGANPFNWLVRRRLMKHQHRVENYDRDPDPGLRDADCSKAFVRERESIIKTYLTQLDRTMDDSKLAVLARRTRGLAMDDIKAAVDNLLDTGKMPNGLQHPTNTCDPYSGNWAEHLMDPYELGKTLVSQGFEFDVLCGYWRLGSNPARRALCGLLNKAITLMNNRSALAVSPYYVLTGTRLPSNLGSAGRC
ncbi:MAG: methyltransferase domain-containing protein [Armatimonadota bacterium]